MAGKATSLQGDVLIEFRRIGAVMRVTALDTRSLVEVTIQGPASAGEAVLERTALAKLHYVMNRRRPA